MCGEEKILNAYKATAATKNKSQEEKGDPALWFVAAEDSFPWDSEAAGLDKFPPTERENF